MGTFRFLALGALPLLLPLACGNDAFGNGDGSDGGNIGADDGGALDGAVEEGGPADPSTPRSVVFRDTEPAKGTVGGVATIGAAADETSITGYDLFWSTDGKAPLGPAITRVGKSGGDVSYTFLAGATAPPGAEFLLARSVVPGVEAKSGVSTYGDNYVHYFDTSSLDVSRATGHGLGGQLMQSGATLLSAGGSAFAKCTLPNGSCAKSPLLLSDGGSGMSAVDAVLDSTTNRIFMPTALGDAPALWICGADGSGCNQKPMTGTPAGNGDGHVAFDAKAHKVVVVHEIGGSPLGVTVCNDDGTGCIFHLGSDNDGYTYAQAHIVEEDVAVDEANGYILIASEWDNTGARLGLVRCPIDFGNNGACVFTDLSTTEGSLSGVTPAVVLDTVHSKMLIVARDQTSALDHVKLHRCDLDGTNCAVTDLSAKAGVASGAGHPHIALDSSQQIWVTVPTTTVGVPTVLRCATDGSGCTAVDLSVGNGGQAEDVFNLIADDVLYFQYADYQGTADPIPVRIGSLRTW
ncbi:MAG: hypothetical protein ABI551_10575 [Polyangiaceae bacterium]